MCDGQLIPEGNRNTILFAYANLMGKDIHVYSCHDPESRLLWFIARYFGDPPYENDIDHFNQQFLDELQRPGMKISNQFKEVSAPAILDRLGPQAILYVEGDNQCYAGDQEFQFWKPVIELELFKILWDVASEINHKRLSIAIAI